MPASRSPTYLTSNRDEVPHLLLTLGAGVTPAQGSVKPTAGFTLNEVYFFTPATPEHLRSGPRLRPPPPSQDSPDACGRPCLDAPRSCDSTCSRIARRLAARRDSSPSTCCIPTRAIRIQLR